MQFTMFLLRLAVFCGLLASGLGCEAAESASSASETGILTPPGAAFPRINGARIFGLRPGSPLLYRMPVTGQRPIHYEAEGLPDGLRINQESGFITGILHQTGTYRIRLIATNALGSAHLDWRLICGDRLALTPPMGWNSYNCWGNNISQEKVLSSANAMVSSGLIEHGWSYVNIDDGWQGERGGRLNALQPNAKFPDLPGMVATLHALGLKFGIYSTPWRGTYAGFAGSGCDRADGQYDWILEGMTNADYRIGRTEEEWTKLRPQNWCFGKNSFVDADAQQWVNWGVDFLKYDWYPYDVPSIDAVLGAIRSKPRDIVLSLSNNGHFEQAGDWAARANQWRTTQDIWDSWDSLNDRGFNEDRWAGYSGPGHWIDPDMLVVGRLGFGTALRPSNLTRDEQYTQISLWALLSAPLILGCDLAALDPFTLSLLSNDEVIELDQDPLGRQATQCFNDGPRVVYGKMLEDGSMALGLFNRGTTRTNVVAHWYHLPMPITGEYRVRDVWRQKDLGTYVGSYNNSINYEVAPHGVVLLRLIPKP